MLGQLCLVLLLEHGLHVRLLGLQLLDGRPEALEEGDLLLEVAHALLLLLLHPSLQLRYGRGLLPALLIFRSADEAGTEEEAEASRHGLDVGQSKGGRYCCCCSKVRCCSEVR